MNRLREILSEEVTGHYPTAAMIVFASLTVLASGKWYQFTIARVAGRSVPSASLFILTLERASAC